MSVTPAARRYLLLTLANFLFFLGVTSFFTLPVHLSELGANRAQIGRIMGSFGFASMFAIPVTGALVDRHGRRLFMVGGALVWVVLALCFARYDALGPELYLLRLGQGLGFSLCFVAVNAKVVDLAPAGGLGRAIAIFGTTTLLSHAIGPSLGEWVASRSSFSVLFVCSAAAALSAALLFASLKDAEPDAPADSHDAARASMNMLSLALRPGARGALVGGLAAAFAFGTAINFMPVFVRARGLPGHAPFFVAYVASAIAVRLLAGSIGDRLGHRRVGLAGVMVFGVSVMAFARIDSLALLAGLGLLFGLAHGVAYPSMNALFVEGVPAFARGRAMALFNLAFNVGITLAAFLAGELAERFGYFWMWLGMGAFSLLAALALFVDREPAAP